MVVFDDVAVVELRVGSNMINNTDPFLNRGDKIGVYEIERRLDSDKLSIRYLALNHHLNERVVLTEYFPEAIALRNIETNEVQPKSDKLKATYNKGLTTFIGRADAFSQVQHDSVLRVHNVLPFNETAYCVAEYSDESSLSIAIERSESELTILLVSLLSALEKIHKKGVIHGSITPEAVRLRADKTPVLAGFDQGFDEDQLASAGMKGRAISPYLALEQYEGHNIGPETDLYSLAAVIYACWSHSEPVASRLRFEAVNSDLVDPLEPVSKLGGAADTPAWGPLIDRMLSIDKQDRPATASVALAEFNRMVEDEKARDGRLANSGGAEKSNAISRILPYAAGIAVIAFLIAIVSSSYRNDADDLNRNIASTTPSSAIQPDQMEVEPTSDPSLAANFAALESNANSHLELPVLEESSVDEQVVVENSKIAKIEKDVSDSSRHKPTDSVVGNDTSTVGQTGESRMLASISRPGNVQSVRDAEQSLSTIASHLNAAKNDFQALRLTTPQGDNAFEHYATVLSLDPDNKEALEGAERIVDMYVWLIGNAMQQGGYKLARIYLARADKIVTVNPSLENLRHQLNSSEN